MKKFLLIITCICLLSGCASAEVKDIKQNIEQNTSKIMEQSTSNIIEQNIKEESALAEKLKALSFEPVSDYYLRNVKQDDADITEMFIPGENSFVRIAMNDDEEEVFSYNYKSDEYCYLYYFSDEQIAKVVYDIGKDKVIEDEYDFFDLVKADAIELKEYFNSLLETADISIEEL